MGLELVQGGLELPPLGVGGRERFRGRGGGLGDGGDQPVVLVAGKGGIVELVVDDADDLAVAAVAVPGVKDAREVGPVGQALLDGELEVLSGPPQQVRARPRSNADSSARLSR